MNPVEDGLHAAVLISVACPAFLLLALMVHSLERTRRHETFVAGITGLAMTFCILGLSSSWILLLTSGAGLSLRTSKTWMTLGGGSFEFTLLIDAWSLSFALVSSIICGTVSAFSYRYLHRESGFYRYFTLYACFVLGILLIALAGSVEVLIAGWELLGLSSALLVGFFHDRKVPLQSAMRVFATYRISDAAMLSAAVLIHHAVGSGGLTAVFLGGESGNLEALHQGEHTAICVLLIVAVAGKSALLPFSGWLPRAMEGPTPSSAVYYGALSVHAGCYLLWRTGPFLAGSTFAQVLAGTIGALTAIHAVALGRVQTDVKASISYATLAQVGIIIVEISLGWRLLAFVHMLGNACLRLLQFLTAPNILQDLKDLESRGVVLDAGDDGGRPPGFFYMLCLERGAIDAMVDRCVVSPFLWIVRLGERMDLFLSGETPEDRQK